jgi:hypothetical protein
VPVGPWDTGQESDCYIMLLCLWDHGTQDRRVTVIVCYCACGTVGHMTGELLVNNVIVQSESDKVTDRVCNYACGTVGNRTAE